MTRLAALFMLLGIALASCSGDTEPGASVPGVSVASRPSSTPTPEPRTFTLVATGDVLLHERLWGQAQRDAKPDGSWDFAPQLANIRPIVEGADIAICHLETPLAQSDATAEGYPTFAAPPEIVPALAETGYDACTTASNHTFDQGAAGVTRTLDRLDQAGIAHTGSARTVAEDQAATLIEVQTGAEPATVGLVSYTYGFNGIPYPDGETWRSNQIDEEAILADAASTRAAGADVVVVAMHWGTEYDQQPNTQQLDLAPRLIGSPDVDLLLGHHSHVVQPVENVAGEWVVYGMGNLMANHAEPEGPRSEGLLMRFTFTEDLSSGGFTVSGAEFLPLYQTYQPPVEVLDVPAALASGSTGSAGADRLETAAERTTAVVNSRGAAEDGLVALVR